MAINVSLLLSPWALFFGILILVVLAIIGLTIVERKLNRKVLKKKEETTFYQKKLAMIKSEENSPKEFLISLDALARDFFAQRFGIDRNAKYSNLIEEFKQQENTSAMRFCQRIQETFYAGEHLEPSELDLLARNLEHMIGEGITPVVKKEKKETKNIEKPINKTIVKYLAEGTKRGFSVPVLKQKLLESGFNENDVDRAVEHLNLHLEEEEETFEPRESEIIQEKVNTGEALPNKGEDNPKIKSVDDMDRLRKKIRSRGAGLV